MSNIIILEEIPSRKWVLETLRKERYLDPNTFIFFKHEWNEKSNQIISHVNSYSQEQNKIHARKCTVKEINLKEHREFCDLYHIQASNRLSIVSFGIFFKDDLLGVLSLGRHNRDSKVTVLDRLCFKAGWRVVGGASKMFSKAKEWALKKGIYSIISFSDERMSTGNIYEKLGFCLDCILPPDYIYLNKKDLNISHSKQSQCKKTTNCPKDITEKEWAERKDLVQVFDAGKKRWIYKLRMDRQVPLKNRRQGYYETKKANPRVIYYQSSYELKAATILDKNKNVKSYVNQHSFSIEGRERITDFIISWNDGSTTILEIKPERRLEEFKNQIEDNKKYANKNGWKFEVWTEQNLGFKSEHYATKWADEFISKITKIDFVKERKDRNLSKSKKYYQENIASDKVEIYCEYCKEVHNPLRITYGRNIARNGKYICEREGGHIAGSRPKPHLKKNNPYESEGKKECNNCHSILLFDSFSSGKSICKRCRAEKYRKSYQKKFESQ